MAQASNALPKAKQKWLADGIIPDQGTVLLYGESGIGKSFVALALANAVQTGTSWAGRKVERGTVLYLAAEDPNGILNRMRSSMEHLGIPNEDGPQLVSGSFDLSRNSKDPADLIEVVSQLPKTLPPVRLMIIDTLQMVLGEADENSATEASAVIRNCHMIQNALGCTVMLVHHSGKDGAKKARGSSAFMAASDTIIHVTGTGDQKTIKVTKQKNGAGGLKYMGQLVPILDDESCILEAKGEWSTEPARSAPTMKSHIVELLANSPVEAIERNDLRNQYLNLPQMKDLNRETSRKSFLREIDKLLRQGVIQQEGNSIRLPSATATLVRAATVEHVQPSSPPH